MILSGGLNPGQRRPGPSPPPQPFAVDIASGTEASPGVKDPDRMRAFFDAVAATLAPRPARRRDAPEVPSP